MNKRSKSEAGRLGATASAATARNNKTGRMEQYASNPKTCRECTKPIEYYKRVNSFCSSSCAATHNLTGKPSHNKNRHSPTKCKICAQPNIKGHAIYCSSECNLIDRHNQTWTKIVEGLITQRPTLKRALVKERGHRCQVCNLTHWNGEVIPLELDHIDGNASSNKPENIRIICPNCHAQTPTAKGRNKGSGRKARGLPRH